MKAMLRCLVIQRQGRDSKDQCLKAQVAFTSRESRGTGHVTQRDELIASLYASGMPIAEIAARAEVCSKTVRNVARRRGLPPRNPPKPLRDAGVVARYQAGDRVSRIAAAHGISRSRVRIIAARAGVPPRAGWQRR